MHRSHHQLLQGQQRHQHHHHQQQAAAPCHTHRQQHTMPAPIRRPAAPVCTRHQPQPLWSLRTAAAGRSSGSAKKQSPVAAGLVSVLKDELKIEKERYRPPEVVLEGPPGGYELEDRPNCTVLLLSREFGSGEEIVVEVDIDAQEGVDEEDDSDVDVDADDGGLDAMLLPVTFTVNIAKGDRIMAFSCETDGTEVHISHVSLSDAPGADEDGDEDGDDEPFAPYAGPVFEELDDTMRQAFADYLEERGIDAGFGRYLMVLVDDKLKVEYMAWLQRAREFVDS